MIPIKIDFEINNKLWSIGVYCFLKLNSWGVECIIKLETCWEIEQQSKLIITVTPSGYTEVIFVENIEYIYNNNNYYYCIVLNY